MDINQLRSQGSMNFHKVSFEALQLKIKELSQENTQLKKKNSILEDRVKEYESNFTSPISE